MKDLQTSQEKESRAIGTTSSSNTQEENTFVDNSPEAKEMQALQSMADNSQETVDGLAWQAKVDEQEIMNGPNPVITEHFKFKGKDDETHTFYSEVDSKGGEHLMMASTPQDLLSVLNEHNQNYSQYYEGNGLLGDLEQAITDTTNLQQHLRVRVNQRDQQWNIDKEDLIQSISTALATLGTHLMWGSTDWTVDWIKPETANYPPIFIGPQTSSVLLQSTLSWYFKEQNNDNLENIRKILSDQEWKDWVNFDQDHDVWDNIFYGTGEGRYNITWPEVTVYWPEERESLPDGETIGLEDQNQITQDTYFTIDGNGGSTPGGDKINNALRPFGYSPSNEKLDGDHARECQLGGEDSLSNLWPLEQDANRAGGVWLDRTKVYDEQNNTLPFPVLVDLVKAGNLDNINLYINIINSNVSERHDWA